MKYALQWVLLLSLYQVLLLCCQLFFFACKQYHWRKSLKYKILPSFAILTRKAQLSCSSPVCQLADGQLLLLHSAKTIWIAAHWARTIQCNAMQWPPQIFSYSSSALATVASDSLQGRWNWQSGITGNSWERTETGDTEDDKTLLGTLGASKCCNLTGYMQTEKKAF